MGFEFVLYTGAIIIAITMAVVVHEVAHGYTALILGDQTAKIMGRLTLNPIAHIHWFGTIVMPLGIYLLTLYTYGQGLAFAFAKPLPVDFRNLRDPKKDMIWVAAAGPGVNIVMAVIYASLLRILLLLSPAAIEMFDNMQHGAPLNLDTSLSLLTLFFALQFFYASVIINVILAIINLIPVPPADGGRIVAGLLPDPQAQKYAAVEPYGLGILILILYFNPLNIINWTIGPVMNGLLHLLLD